MFNKQLAAQMRGSSRPYTFAEHKAAFERDMSRRGFIKGAGALAAAATLAVLPLAAMGVRKWFQ